MGLRLASINRIGGGWTPACSAPESLASGPGVPGWAGGSGNGNGNGCGGVSGRRGGDGGLGPGKRAGNMA